MWPLSNPVKCNVPSAREGLSITRKLRVNGLFVYVSDSLDVAGLKAPRYGMALGGVNNPDAG